MTFGYYTGNQQAEFGDNVSHSIGLISGTEQNVSIGFAVEKNRANITGLENVTLSPQEFGKNYYDGSEYLKATEIDFSSYPQSPESSFTLDVYITPLDQKEGVTGDLEFQRTLEFSYSGRGYSYDGQDPEEGPEIEVGGSKDDDQNRSASQEPGEDEYTQVTNSTGDKTDSGNEVSVVLVLSSILSLGLLAWVII